MQGSGYFFSLNVTDKSAGSQFRSSIPLSPAELRLVKVLLNVSATKLHRACHCPVWGGLLPLVLLLPTNCCPAHVQWAIPNLLGFSEAFHMGPKVENGSSFADSMTGPPF